MFEVKCKKCGAPWLFSNSSHIAQKHKDGVCPKCKPTAPVSVVAYPQNVWNEVTSARDVDKMLLEIQRMWLQEDRGRGTN